MDTSKIIRGVVSNGRYTVTAPIVKEDYGLYLQIEGVELPSTYEVDFSNSENNGTSVTMIGNADGVLIPHQFIDSGKDVFAFLYHVGEDFGRTVYKFRIPNKVRPDRTNEEPTPEEQSTIDQAISALNEAVEQTTQDVISADASAQSAQGYAEQAESARDTAQSYANNAQTSATQASTSASQASTSATASSQSSQSAEQSAQNAHTYALSANTASGTAENFADVASGYASLAQGYAQSASASAQSASGYASNAQSSAQTASSKASEASQSATAASNKATESAQSASQALGYKTDAEQAKTDAQTAQGFAESARDSAISAKTDAESAKADAESARDEAVQAVESISGALDDKADVITDTASGSIASFPDGADGIPLKSLVVDIDPVQDLHGQESPYPAGGGKNLFNKEDYEYKKYLSHNNGNTSTSTGNPPWDTSGYIKVTPGMTYVTSPWTVTTSSEWCFYDADKVFISGKSDRTRTATAPENAAYVRVDFPNTVLDTFQLEKGSTATAYAPYENICHISGWTGMQLNANGTVIPISWQTEAGTVYGGKLDVLSGVLRVYPYYASYNGETLTGRWISDRDVYAVGTTPTIGAQVVNIGAEGTEIQLEPHEVKSLLGANNLFADTGDTEVEYRADTKLYINRLTEPDADMIADSNIVSGQYFMVGNNLYKATANIASGASVIVGTNATRKSLSEALNEINV